MSEERFHRVSDGRIAAEILPRLKQMLTAARKVGMKIVYTQAFVSRIYKFGCLAERSKQAISWGGFCRQGSRGSEIHSQVTPLAGDIVIPKYRYSAFIGTNLEVILRAHESVALFLLDSRPMSASKARYGCLSARLLDRYGVLDSTAASAPEFRHFPSLLRSAFRAIFPGWLRNLQRNSPRLGRGILQLKW